MGQKKKYTAILTSRGIQTEMGYELMKEVMQQKKISLEHEKIFIFSPHGEEIDALFVQAFVNLGFLKVNILLSSQVESQPVAMLPKAKFVYVPEGNTFEVMAYLRNYGFDRFIKQLVEDMGVYIGSSAGAIIASEDISLAEDFDSNYMGMKNHCGLQLVKGTLIPHYTRKELQTYLKNTPERNALYSVDHIQNNELLFLKLQKDDGEIEVLHCKRIRR